MKLSACLSADFEAEVRARGASYFRSGAVQLASANPRQVYANVQGSRTYDVQIDWDGRTLTLYCECPYFEATGPCKHLWATILASDLRDCFSAITRFNPKSVFYDRADSNFEEEMDDQDDEAEEEEEAFALALPAPPPAPPPVPAPAQPPAWKQRLAAVAPPTAHYRGLPSNCALAYYIDVPASERSSMVVLTLATRQELRGGGWNPHGPPQLQRQAISHLPDALDRQILSLLSGSMETLSWFGGQIPTTYKLLDSFAAIVVPLLTRTGRCVLTGTALGAEAPSLAWDEGDPWQLDLRLDRLKSGEGAVSGYLRRGEETKHLADPLLMTNNLMFTANRVSLLEEGTPREWVAALSGAKPLTAPAEDVDQLLMALVQHPSAIHLEVPEDLRYEEVRLAPRPWLTITAAKRNAWEKERLRADLTFEYGTLSVNEHQPGRGIFDAQARQFLMRDESAEEAAKGLLKQLGPIVSRDWPMSPPVWQISARQLPAVVHSCLEAGWRIEADGKVFRRPGAVQMRVSSGVDWFELHGEVDYGGAVARLPALLAALRRGESMVRLDDGTFGMLPEEWLKRFGTFVGLGSTVDDHVRFRRNQTGVLDALLAAQPEVSCDETFARVREELKGFAGIGAAAQPEGFVGHLRDYQRDGVAWMEFLRRFGFGGCLADDMGVGKTAQVLALLETRRASRTAPSLVVVPKSLVFNWKQEAAKFTPQLRILDHTGNQRDVKSFGAHDVVLTTYGTLRRDAADFRDVEFDYIVLDEAQAIKNANTDSAKAARLLKGKHRLAMSGTPVENHLGELWSIFEFLNPGMLGSVGVLKLAGGMGRNPSEETRHLLAHALRPFILRRTKEQVARELPAKSEQTIFCELEPKQRKLYNELRAHYRNSLLNTVAAQGLAKSKIQVLEALLRLRQAACHPGLLDPKRRTEPSAKLDVLINQLAEVTGEGHKALVFSQFTSLLSIVRERLDGIGIVYEYLDGATTDRQHHVERFQNDAGCPVFLISLKAGGLGLNLTAAEYVFLLDPWWNPAVEAQAIDRAHRIGQARQVFAYRLIAQDTVEEKVLQLQNSKRELAAAIIGEDNSLIRSLKREDLELLLS